MRKLGIAGLLAFFGLAGTLWAAPSSPRPTPAPAPVVLSPEEQADEHYNQW